MSSMTLQVQVSTLSRLWQQQQFEVIACVPTSTSSVTCGVLLMVPLCILPD